MPVVADGFLRLAGAIVLETLALVIWNVGSRSPVQAIRDLSSVLRQPRTLAVGFLAFAIGLIFIAAGTVLLLPAVPNPHVFLAPVEIFTLLVALGFEFLIGADVRRLAGGRPKDPA